MKKSNLIFKIFLAIIAFLFTLTISKIVPKHTFYPYKLLLDSTWKKENTEQEYFIDIDNDKNVDKIVHHNINIAGHSIEFHKDKNIEQIHIFKYGEEFIGKYLKFTDIDSNNTQELIFVSAKNFIAYLNIFSYDTSTKKILLKERISIDTLGKFNDKIDAENNFIITYGDEIYFDLQSNYSIQPRNIYKYNYNDKSLIKNRLNSFVTPQAQLFNYQNKKYLLASYVRATGNTLSPEEIEMLRNSKDEDTLAIYEELKNLEYEYGDFASYILLYNDSLNFAFEPIEYFGWTNFTKATIVFINNKPYIVAFTNAQMNKPDNEKCKLVNICNLQGEIIRQIPLPYNYSDIFSQNSNIVFYGNKNLFITDTTLALIKKISNITFAQGFEDINNDGKPEFIAFSNNLLKIYSSAFKINAVFKIEQEFTPYPEENSFYILKSNNQNSFIFNTRLFYYKFNYENNKLAFFKYPFYLAIFLTIFLFLFVISRFNSKRLEKENLKLEQIITERTKEIATQKEEIQTQANELEIKNKNLIELSKFKKLMTNTIIHDLKNPLSYIIANSQDKIKQSGYNMLNIILNILDINKAQTTKLNVMPEKHNVSDLIDNAISQIVFLAEEKNLKIEKMINKDFFIIADKELTVRIIVNLLTNALKYSSLNNKITIQANKNNDFVQIDITNYGIGISKDNINRIFEEYTQLDAKKSGKIKSTGLGLTFCKIAAEAQNAKISVSSVPNQKTTFSLLFPLVDIAEKQTQQTQTEKNEKTEKIEISLTNQERLKIQNTLQQLRQTSIFEATKILNLLNTIQDSSENIKIWKQKLKTAMYASNSELFYKMIDNELQNINN